MILITSISEFLLYYSRFFYLFHFTIKEKKKKKISCRTVFGVVLCCPIFTAGISSGLEIQKAGYSLYCIHVYEGLQEPVMAKSATCGEESK